MIDKAKLPKTELAAMEKDANIVRQAFDEAHLLAVELRLDQAALPLVALMLLTAQQISNSPLAVRGILPREK